MQCIKALNLLLIIFYTYVAEIRLLGNDILLLSITQNIS